LTFLVENRWYEGKRREIRWRENAWLVSTITVNGFFFLLDRKRSAEGKRKNEKIR